MNHTLAKIISVVLHPLLIFVALYAFLLSQRQFHISTLSMMRHDSFLIVLLTIATILCILLFYKLKWIKTLTLSDSHDRLIAYLCFIVELCIVINLNLIDKNMNPVLFLMISIVECTDQHSCDYCFLENKCTHFFYRHCHRIFAGYSSLLHFQRCFIVSYFVYFGRHCGIGSLTTQCP